MSKLEEYSGRETESMRKIFNFVGLSPSMNRNKAAKPKRTVENKGYDEKPIWAETKAILKKFFVPFNVQLANLLNDTKWLW